MLRTDHFFQPKQFFNHYTNLKFLFILLLYMYHILLISSKFILFFVLAHNWIIVALSMVGKFGISGVYGEVFIYTGELFPTVVRSFVIAVCSFGGRIGSNSSPYMFRLVRSEYHFCITKIRLSIFHVSI